MKPVLGILLVGGGAFILVALFNGTLHFPLGNVNGLGNLPFTPQTPNIIGSSAKQCNNGGKGFDPNTGRCL